MRVNIERDELLADVLADVSPLRSSTLALGLAEMQRVRKRRRATRVAALVCAPLLVIAMAVFFREVPAPHRKVAPPRVLQAQEMIPGTSIRVLSDEELLALFKDRPVALVGHPGNQRLLLLDEVIH